MEIVLFRGDGDTDKRTDGRMDRQTNMMKLIVNFHSFAKAPINQMEGFEFFFSFLQPHNYSNLRIMLLWTQ